MPSHTRAPPLPPPPFPPLTPRLYALSLSLSGWAVLILNVFAVFAFLWVQLVFINISLVTTCGAVGSWYFSPAETTSRGCLLCRPAVCMPLLRACTTSLGSIALGSLLVAIVRTIIVIVRFCAESAGSQSSILKLAFCCCICLISCLERCLKWLTDYAFVYVAVYGTPFITSGTKVLELLASSGVGAIAQQTLVTPVLSLAALLGAGCGGALGYTAHEITGISRYHHSVGILVGASVGFFLTLLGLAPVDAGSKTLFVCYAESPRELASKSPELHAKLREGAPLTPKDTSSMVQP